MFQIFLFSFAGFGLLALVFTAFQLMRRSFTDAVILYPMYREQGDAYFTLRTLSSLCLPMVVITKDGEDFSSLENEFLYADFVSQSDFSAYIHDRYIRKDT